MFRVSVAPTVSCGLSGSMFPHFLPHSRNNRAVSLIITCPQTTHNKHLSSKHMYLPLCCAGLEV